MTEIEAYRNLANAVVEKAATDWRQKCEKKDATDISFDSLRNFFRSEWARMLCGNVSPTYILAKLEKERKQAHENRRTK